MLLDNRLALEIRYSRTVVTDAHLERDVPARRPRGRGTKSDTNASLRALKKHESLCINGRLDGRPGRGGIVHGEPVTPGGKCARCVEIWRRTK